MYITLDTIVLLLGEGSIKKGRAWLSAKCLYGKSQKSLQKLAVLRGGLQFCWLD